jgi:hypothetical protein
MDLGRGRVADTARLATKEDLFPGQLAPFAEHHGDMRKMRSNGAAALEVGGLVRRNVDGAAVGIQKEVMGSLVLSKPMTRAPRSFVLA